jgi:hypothetical protein
MDHLGRRVARDVLQGFLRDPVETDAAPLDSQYDDGFAVSMNSVPPTATV